MIIRLWHGKLAGCSPGHYGECGGQAFLSFLLSFFCHRRSIADKYEKSVLIRWVKVLEITIMAVAAVAFI
ncbi:MAG: hypothetical protein R2874_10880 [Desulfobacterales bacterium]